MKAARCQRRTRFRDLLQFTSHIESISAPRYMGQSFSEQLQQRLPRSLRSVGLDFRWLEAREWLDFDCARRRRQLYSYAAIWIPTV